MSNFKVGEKVVCVNVDAYDINDGMLEPHPNKGDIVEISGIEKDGWLCFIEMPKNMCYEPWNFRKLDHQFSEDVIAEIIKQIKEESLTLAN